jgi:hypothetical protein
MYPDRIPGEQLPRESSHPLLFHGPNDGSADHAVPPLPNVPLPNSSDNPEFTRWWRRWVSRVRLTTLRNPARRFQIGRKNKDKSTPEDKTAQGNGNGVDRVGARESGDTFN